MKKYIVLKDILLINGMKSYFLKEGQYVLETLDTLNIFLKVEGCDLVLFYKIIEAHPDYFKLIEMDKKIYTQKEFEDAVIKERNRLLRIIS